MYIPSIILKKTSVVGKDPTHEKTSLFQFMWQEKLNRYFILIALASTTLQFITFKNLYPFADFFSDSYSYIYAAYANLDINIWPIGYSKFLRLFHHYISHDDTALIAFQYFFLELSLLYFFFTILYFYTPRKTTKVTLFIFLFFNPLFLYLSNYVNSDPLFAAVSLLWFSQLLWIIERPSIYQIFLNALLLFSCFTIRNNAYCYPFITAIAFLLSKQSLWRRITGGVLGLTLIIPFILWTREAAYKITGTRQYSLFTGWQLANNALYMYGHIQVDSNKLPTAETKALDQISKQFFQFTKPEFDDYLSDYVANYFIRQPEAPLKQYLESHYQLNDELSIVVSWGKASTIFSDYGSWLIKNYPIAFTNHFILRNIRNYISPPLEKLEIYNLGLDEVAPIAAFWFDYKSLRVTSVSKNVQGKILSVYPILFLLINLYFIMAMLWVSVRTNNVAVYRSAVLTACFLLLNFCFSVFATINVFRYQVFPMIVCFTFSLLLMECLGRKKTGET